MNNKNPTITVKSASAWFFGIAFLLGGIGTLASNIVGGLVFIALSLILLPPIVKKLPITLSSGIKFVLVLVGLGIIGATTDTSTIPTTPSTTGSNTGTAQKVSPPPVKEETATLELLSTNETRQYSFINVTGEVKNISSKPLDAVQVVVSFYTADGTFVKESSAMIEYNPILAGQTSPFKVVDTDNPAIENWKVEFKKLFGGTIPTKRIK